MSTPAHLRFHPERYGWIGDRASVSLAAAAHVVSAAASILPFASLLAVPLVAASLAAISTDDIPAAALVVEALAVGVPAAEAVVSAVAEA